MWRAFAPSYFLRSSIPVIFVEEGWIVIYLAHPVHERAVSTIYLGLRIKATNEDIVRMEAINEAIMRMEVSN